MPVTPKGLLNSKPCYFLKVNVIFLLIVKKTRLLRWGYVPKAPSISNRGRIQTQVCLTLYPGIFAARFCSQPCSQGRLPHRPQFRVSTCQVTLTSTYSSEPMGTSACLRDTPHPRSNSQESGWEDRRGPPWGAPSGPSVRALHNAFGELDSEMEPAHCPHSGDSCNSHSPNFPLTKTLNFKLTVTDATNTNPHFTKS